MSIIRIAANHGIFISLFPGTPILAPCRVGNFENNKTKAYRRLVPA